MALILAAGCGEGMSVDEVQVEVSPLTGRQGETLTLFVEGVGTGFHAARADGDEADPVVAIVGEADGLVLGRVIVDNEHRARIPAYIAPTSTPSGEDGGGKRRLMVTTAGRSWQFDFEVQASPDLPRILLEPDSGVAGTEGVTVDVLALDDSMTFDDETVVTFTDDSGVHVQASELSGPSHIRLSIRIDEEASPGLSSASVTSRGDVATHPFEIHDAGGTRLWVFPQEAPRGTTQTLNMVVEGMTLAPEDLAVTFPFNPAIHVDSVGWASEGSASCEVTIDEDAPVGAWQMVVSSADQEASSTFRVLPTTNTEPFLKIFPAALEQGAVRRDVFITGVYTHFAEGVSELELAPASGIQVDGFWILDEETQQGVARLGVDEDAPLAPSVITVTTGDEVASGIISVVQPPELVLRVSPSSVTQGDRGALVNVTVEGADLLASTSAELAAPDLSGIHIRSWSVIDAGTAQASLDVSDTAPTGSTLLTLDLEGVQATAPMTVAPSTSYPEFSISPPYLSIPSGEVTVTLTGEATSWVDGETTLMFSEPSIEVRDLTITGPQSATATVVGPPWVAQRRVVAYMASPDEIAASWWTLLPPAHRGIILYPDEIQAGEDHTVLVVGEETSFVQGLTTALLPPTDEIRVSGVTVYDPDLAMVSISTSADAPAGSWALSLTTGGETALGSLRITAGDLPETLPDPGAVVVETPTDVRLVADPASFTSATTVRVGAPGLDGLVTGVPVVVDPSTLDVEVYAYASLAGTVVPLEVTTDLEVLRGCVAVVDEASAPHARFTPMAVRPDVTRTLTVTSLGSPAVDFTIDPPEVTTADAVVTVVDTAVLDASTMEVQIQVGDGSLVTDSAVQVQLQGARYLWHLVIPVLDPPPRIQVDAGDPILAGTVSGTLNLTSRGLGLADPSLSVASPSPILFAESIESTGATTADLVYHTAVRETDGEAALFVLPQATPWAVGVDLAVQRADVRVVGVPSTVMETIPAQGPDLVRFTPAADASLALWTLLDGGSTSVPWTMLAPDGISVTARVPVGGILALPDTVPSRHHVRVGPDPGAGTSYWLSVASTFSGIDRFEAEPNDSIASARGLSPPGTPASLLLASLERGGDEDFFQIPSGPPTCYQALSTRMTGGTFSSPYLWLSLLDASGARISTASGGPGHMDPIICTDGSGTAPYLVVRGLAATAGPYILQPRVPLIISELEHDPFTGPWVEIQGPAGFDVTGWTLQVVDGATGTVRGTVDLAVLSTIPDDGLALVVSPSSPAAGDVTSTVLDDMVSPYALRLCHESLGICDRVQVGGTGNHGEGEPLDPADVPAGRIWDVDTGRNSLDFQPFVSTTGGSPGGLPLP